MMPSHMQQQPSSHQDFSSQLQRRPADFIADQELENASGGVSASAVNYRKPTVLLPTVPEKCGPPTISLALLLDFAIQHTLHEITILSELLPKKKETERKISVVQFAHSTRLIFVKLLAIVKWIKQSKKFEPLTAIRYFLDQQAMHFVDTADRLVAIARDELRFARLPVFQVAQAVDVLTLGTYPRLPQDIKDWFILKPSLSKEEQALTLCRLNHVLEYQLSLSSETISPRIDSVLIRNGMVIMQVSGEFEINLTMLGEDASEKWCLLNIKILVENYDVGYGQKLVHPLQVNFLHQIVQEKLQNGAEPLLDVYLVLHSFCRSLQLDVLYCQVLQLSTVSQNYLRVEEYDHVKCVLVISYWLTKNPKKRLVSNYRITIFGSKEDQHCGLKTRHHPSAPYLPVLEESDNLSLSRLISETILFRCRERFLRIQRLLSMLEPSISVQQSGHSMMTLTYPLIVYGEQHPDESLHIAINTFSGSVVCNVPALTSNEELVTELENQLSAAESSLEAISKLVNRMRVLVMIERFNKAICGLQVRSVSENQAPPLLAKLKELPADRRLLQFNREEKFFLVVIFLPELQFGVVLELYLFYSHAGKCNMMKLDPMEVAKSTPVPLLDSFSSAKGVEKKLKWLGSHRQLQAAVASIDDRLLFLRITEELDHRHITYKPLEVEPVVGGHVLKIDNVASAMGIKCEDFFKNLVGCKLRLDLRQNLNWPFECTMKNCPLVADFDENKAGCSTDKNRTRTWVQPVHSSTQNPTLSVSEAVSQNILERLSIYCHVYELVKKFSYAYKAHFKNFCNIQAYTYHKLVMAYGKDKDQLMMLTWRPEMVKEDKNKDEIRIPAQYTICFGQTAVSKKKRRWNPHICVAHHLAKRFNREKDLSQLVQYLISTCDSLEAIYNFSKTKLHSVRALSQVLAIDASVPIELQSNLSSLDDTTLRLTNGITHLEFLLLSNNQVAVRDCSRLTFSHASLDAFWRKQIDGPLSLLPSTSNTQDKPNLPPTRAPTSPYHSPKSYPSQQSSSFSPAQKMTLSVPSISLDTSSTTLEASSPRPQDQTNTSSSLRPVVLNYASLARAMNSEEGPSPLENYLYALTFLGRMHVVLDASRKATGINQIPIKDMQSTQDSVTVTILCYPLSGLKDSSHPPLLKLSMYVCPREFKLVAKLAYNGINLPADTDVQIFERFFENHVCQLFNEMAVFTFISICRIAYPPIFSSFAHIMLAQMEPQPNYKWKINLQLTTSEQQPQTNQRKVLCGVIVTETFTKFLFMISIRPAFPTAMSNERGMDRRQLQLHYKVSDNELSLYVRGQLSEEEQTINNIIKQQQQLQINSQGCSIWSCIKDILENYSI